MNILITKSLMSFHAFCLIKIMKEKPHICYVPWKSFLIPYGNRAQNEKLEKSGNNMTRHMRLAPWYVNQKSKSKHTTFIRSLYLRSFHKIWCCLMKIWVYFLRSHFQGIWTRILLKMYKLVSSNEKNECIFCVSCINHVTRKNK